MWDPAYTTNLLPTPWRPHGGPLCRAGALSPYALEQLVEDARWAGPGARLDLVIDAPVSSARWAAIEAKLAPLAARGIRVNLQRRTAPGRRAA